MRTDMENVQTIIYQKKYQEALKEQLDDVLDKLNSNQFDTIDEYLHVCYENGYIGTMYDLQHQGIPLAVPMNQKNIVKAIQVDTKLSSNHYKSNPLKGRLAEDVDRMKTSIRAELSRGIANGSSWNDVAVNVAKGMNNPIDKAYKDAIRIARTEGHRVQQSATLEAQKVAKDKGADVLKQWDSTMDSKTRPTHQRLDGQIREIEEPFEIDGKQAMFAGDFGIPSEDINCRCIITQRARWALDEEELDTLKERAEFFGLDKSEDFEDFKQKYLRVADEEDIQGKLLGYESEVERLTKEYKKATLEAMMDFSDESMMKAQELKKQLDSAKSNLDKFKVDYAEILEKIKKAKEVPIVDTKFAKITSAKEAQGKLLELGFNSVHDGISKLNGEMMVDMTNQLSNLEKKFGAISKGRVSIDVDRARKAKSSVSSFGGDSRTQTLNFSQYMKKSKKEIIEDLKNEIKEGFKMPVAEGQHSFYTVTHEYGHIIENNILGDWFTNLPKEKQKELSFDGLKMSLWRDEHATKIRSEIVAIAKEKSNDPYFLSHDYVSGYGKSNSYEFFAEAFANSQLGEPNIIGDSMNEWLKKKGLILE